MKDKPTGPRGVAYLRVSSDQQDMRSQRESVERWLAARNLTVIEWYEDVGPRDLADQRPEFQRLLKGAQAGLFDWAVVDAKDRFGTRDNYEFGKFVSLLRKHDVQLWSVTQGCLTADDPMTEMLVVVDGLRSRDEQVARSQRSIRAKISAVERGEWPGGYPPFGYDVVCLGTDRKEKWRVFYEGAHRRLKIYADGRPPERFDGKGVFPARDKGDVLHLVPSLDRERVETVRRIFGWVVSESISLRAICTRLNDLGISPVIGPGWYASRLKPMLLNPVYVTGRPTWNKKGHGRFTEFVNGEYRAVPRTRDKVLTGRTRSEGDFVQAAEEDRGIIDRATWEAVQAKLRTNKRSARAPKNSDLWLAGLLFCGHCGKRMAAWHQRSDPTCPNSYTCASYRMLGRNNPTGCRLHRVKQEVIEAVMDRYLEETGRRLESLLNAEEESRFIEELERQAERARLECTKAVCSLWHEVRSAPNGPDGSPPSPPPGQPWTGSNLCDAYRATNEKVSALTEKEAEMGRLVARFAKLTSQVATEAANKHMEALEREIVGLREELRGRRLDENLQELRACLRRLEHRLAEARRTLPGDDNRRKAAAVGRVINRIVCRFRHEQAGSQARSILVQVVVEPLVGEERTFDVDADLRNGSWPGPGSRWCAPPAGCSPGSPARARCGGRSRGRPIPAGRRGWSWAAPRPCPPRPRRVLPRSRPARTRLTWRA